VLSYRIAFRGLMNRSMKPEYCCLRVTRTRLLIVFIMRPEVHRNDRGHSARQMSDFARFRNILVHRYWEVDNERVIKKLKDDLRHIEDFLRKASTLAM
jgi:hypothetical protein